MPEAGQRQLLGHRVAADVRLLLEDDDLEPGRGEVRRADQAVVAGADDDDVRAVPAHAARTSPLGNVCRRSAPSSVTSSSSPVCTPEPPVRGGDVGLDDDGHARLQRHVRRGPDGAAARADDRRQVSAAEAVDEVVDRGEPGVLDDVRRVDQLLRVHARPQPRGDGVERRLGHLVQLLHLALGSAATATERSS